MPDLAPVVLFAFNRPRHLRQTLEALAGNHLAAETDLIVYTDGPRSRQDEASVKAVSQILGAVSGFASVTVHASAQNLGLAHSVIRGVSAEVATYGRVIVLEDDMVTVPQFLSYMNNGLDLYQDDTDVASILAYNYPIDDLPDTYFILGADCWGWATWQRAWQHFEPDGEKLLRLLTEQHLLHRFDMNGAFPYTRMLKRQIKGEDDSWAIRWYASALLNQKLSLYPGRALLQNIGNEGSGTHQVNASHYDTSLASAPVSLERIPVVENTRALDKMSAWFRQQSPPFHQKVITKIRHMWRNRG